MNERGQYGASTHLISKAAIGSSEPSGRSHAPWILGGVGLAIAGLAVIAARTAKRQRPNPHDKEVRAWEAEFPGLPWYMDQVKDSRQLDMWERARDHWERTR